MTQPITAPCNRDRFPAYRSSGERPLGQIEYVVLHDTEGGTARSIAAYFATASAQGSAHLVLDGKECQRCLADTTIPWGAPGFNSNGFHIEQCGYASWSKARWLVHPKLLRRAAFKVAQHCDKFGLPCYFVDAAGLRAGVKGVTTHWEITKSGLSPGGTHTDPGSGYPIKLVMFLARRRLKKLRAA